MDVAASRTTIETYFLDIAHLVATRATCPRRQAGCVIVNKYNHIIATGFNGVPKGYQHCTDHPCGGQDSKTGQNLGSCMATHAEQNALLQCKDVQEIDTIYITTSPCSTCAKLIANTGCKTVIYSSLYSGDLKGLEMLSCLGIKVINYERIYNREKSYRPC